MAIQPEVAALLTQMGDLFIGVAEGRIEGIVVHDREKGLHVIKINGNDGRPTSLGTLPLDFTQTVNGGGDRGGQQEVAPNEQGAPRTNNRQGKGAGAGKGKTNVPAGPRVLYRLKRKPKPTDSEGLTELGQKVLAYLVERGADGATSESITNDLKCAASTAGNVMSAIRKRQGLVEVVKLDLKGKQG